MLGVVTAGGVGVAPAAGATQDDVATACHLDRASPETVGDLRERAQQRVGELEKLNAESTVAVDQARIETIADRVENGNISYDRARYQRACGHYQIALDQSTATLERLYISLAETRLASVEDQLKDRQQNGYDSMEMSNFSARHESLSEQTENVSSLPQARTVASEAAELQADTAALPKMRVVRVASTIAPFWRPVLGSVGFTLVIGGLGVFVGRSTVDATAQSPGEEENNGVEGTRTRDSGGQRRNTFESRE